MHSEHKFPLYDILFRAHALRVLNDGVSVCVFVNEVGDVGAGPFRPLSVIAALRWYKLEAHLLFEVGYDAFLLHEAQFAGATVLLA